MAGLFFAARFGALSSAGSRLAQFSIREDDFGLAGDKRAMASIWILFALALVGMWFVRWDIGQRPHAIKPGQRSRKPKPTSRSAPASDLSSKDMAGCLVGILGLPFFVIAPSIWGYQVIQWLKTGGWEPIPVRTGLMWAGVREPLSPYGGVEKIIRFVVNSPLSLATLVPACALLFLLMILIEESETARRG